MNKLIMLLESIKNSNYIIEENYLGMKELTLKDSNNIKYLTIQFNTVDNNNHLWKISDEPFKLYEYIGSGTIEELEKIIKDFYE